MTQERLKDLAVLSIHSEVARTIDLDELKNDFAELKVRKRIVILGPQKNCNSLYIYWIMKAVCGLEHLLRFFRALMPCPTKHFLSAEHKGPSQHITPVPWHSLDDLGEIY